MMRRTLICMLLTGIANPAHAGDGCNFATDTRKGKISRNFYRIPYDDNTVMRTTNYVTHCGSLDSAAVNDAAAVLVAAAPGRVVTVLEHFNDCGSAGAFGSFGNQVTILHANGEASRYLHLAQWSPSSFGITVGMYVSAGTPVGIEGDVGRTSGSTAEARVGTCLETMPPDTGDCGRHTHWNIIRYETDELLNPLTCGMANNLYADSTNYVAPCDGGGSYATNATLTNESYASYGAFRVVQAHQQVTASTVQLQNYASMVLHAGNKVRLLPGFRVDATAYFRADIGAPDVTAPSARPVPSQIPCTDAVGFCYQWSDLSSPGDVIQGCPSPGPDIDNCIGCPDLRCCPCMMNGTCEF